MRSAVHPADRQPPLREKTGLAMGGLHEANRRCGDCKYRPALPHKSIDDTIVHWPRGMARHPLAAVFENRC